MMKKFLLNVLIFFPVVFLSISCSDPIFEIVSNEPPKRESLIGGSPTNFVTIGSDMYVASGKNIWKYNNGWEKKYTLNGRVTSLAATNNSLYAVYLSDRDNNGKIINCASSEVLPLSEVQSIFEANNTLFACTGNNNNYLFHYYNTSTSSFNDITGINPSFVLLGVVYGSTNYYFCTNSGIYYLTSLSSPTALIVKNDSGQDISDFTGIINLSASIVVAITKTGGYLYQISGTTASRKASFNDGRLSTGALAIWKDQNSTQELLLVGRSEEHSYNITAYTNGYVEIEIDSSGITGTSFKEPGKSPSSINNYEKYVSSLGKKIINYMYLANDGILFASTHKDGLWSYRDHNDGEGISWNAE